LPSVARIAETLLPSATREGKGKARKAVRGA
jgi:hypothetical protein